MKRVLMKFAVCVDKGDEFCRFEVLEENGDRLLVREISACSTMMIRPTYVYLRRDLVEVDK